jgi:hypothetical protein
VALLGEESLQVFRGYGGGDVLGVESRARELERTRVHVGREHLQGVAFLRGQ